MSNSKLASYTRLSPNCNKPRNHKIDKITIHHMAGNLTLDGCYNAVTSRGGSSNYAIASDGKVGLFVEECNRSWCSSSPSNDHRAITIEVANDKPSDKDKWHVSDKALAKLIDLCEDICRRNGIKKLNFTGDASGNLTMHKYFAPTACPGPYLESKFKYIADEVNKRLNADCKPAVSSTAKPSKAFKPYKVKITYKGGMNVRKGAGVGCALVRGVTAKYNYIYTITAEKVVAGQTWGKLKSGAGWICLTGFTKRV